MAAHGLMSGCRERSERQDEVAKRRRVAAPDPLADNFWCVCEDNKKGGHKFGHLGNETNMLLQFGH
jgi:hypothetical protein